MKLWNVFKMELFKNIHSRANLVLMLSFMLVNILGGIAISSQSWFAMTNMDPMIATLFSFSIFGTAIFLFLYPYQMARDDYRNKVMSLLIASGVSRIQYYFVKVGATLLFSLLSIILLVILPLLIVLSSHNMQLVIEFFQFSFQIDLVVIGVILVAWLSTFSMLMTAVIIARGRRFTIFIFLGLSIATSQVALVFRSMFGIHRWHVMSTTGTFIQYLSTMAVMGLIGILVLRKQNL